MRWALLLLFPLLALATERAPWTSDPFLLEGRIRYSFETFDRIGGQPFHSDNHYLNLALVGTPWSNVDLEGEIQIAYTKTNDPLFEYGKLTARRVWLDDIAGDPITITSALTLIGATHDSVVDPSTPIVGTIGGEVQLGAAKEWIRCGHPLWRNWCMGAFGYARKSSGWLRGEISTQRHFCRCHRVWIALHGRLGLGDEPLPRLDRFDGYGDVAYRAIDLKVGYGRPLGCGELSLHYLYRLYARNFPEEVNQISIQLIWPLWP